MRVTVGNLKGGVSKSTSSVYIALALALIRGERVLLVDADGRNRTVLKWSTLAEDWPASVTVVSWPVTDLARRVQAVMGDYQHVVIDTGPIREDLLAQALLVTDELVIPVAPSPIELEQLSDTFDEAAKVDVISPVYPHVLLTCVQVRTNSRVMARQRLTELELPTLTSEIRLLEQYKLNYGAVPTLPELAEYDAVLTELEADSDSDSEGAA